MTLAPGAWRIRVDAGGTFTDGWALDPAGVVRRAKVLSSSALRAVVRSASGPDDVLVRGAWTGSPRAAVGLTVTWAGGRPCLVRAAAPAGGPAGDPGGDEVRLALDGSPPPPGTTITLSSAEPSAVLCARVLADVPAGEPLPPGDLRVATTRATNALLERRGARTAVLVTRGFRDLPRIGDQRRPDLFARVIRRPVPLFERVDEVDERVAPDGAVLRRLDEDAAARLAGELAADGIEAVAVCLLHAVRHPGHERRVAGILRDAGIAHVSTSVDGAARGPIVPRLATTIVDAFVGPVLGQHLRTIAAAAGGEATGAAARTRLRVLASDGGVRSAESFRPAEGLLSGPAGGVAGAAAAARRTGFPRAIGLDMGGTSTDVCRIDGEPVLRGEHRVGDATVLAPALAIETVAAGGGSICSREDGRLRVGPRSAGAAPGPACHGDGGPLTLTDCTLLLGRMAAERFPFPPDTAAASDAADALLAEVGADDPAADRDALLAGCCDLAAESMADAIRAVTVREGWDPAEHALVAFGGAGGQHACAIAERLGIGSIVFPADASILSAVGLHAACPRAVVRRELLTGLDEAVAGDGLKAAIDDATDIARRRLLAEGAEAGDITLAGRRLHVRQLGQDATMEIDLASDEPSANDLRSAFEAAWRRVFGHDPVDTPLEIESVEVRLELRSVDEAEAETQADDRPTNVDAAPPSVSSAPTAQDARRVHLGGDWIDLPTIERSELASGSSWPGPLMITDDRTSVLLHPGWRLDVTVDGDLVARFTPPASASAAAADAGTAAAESGIVRRELTGRRLRAIAVEMGEQLRRTARSVNVRERLDFSCGVLDAEGRLLASAPHVPVHLGALGACVRAVIAQSTPGPDDVIVVNHPAFGGSHLPDVTVLAPVDLPGGGPRLGYVAARAHHAEIGGLRPGSMAPSACTLAEEGIVLPPTAIIEGGRDRFDRVAALLAAGPHPSRRPADNLADLRAQVAACRRGAEGLRHLAAAIGPAGLAEDATAMLLVSRSMVRAGLTAFAGRTVSARDALDDGTAVAVTITVPQDPSTVPAIIDFTGSGAVHPRAFNAPRAVTAAAVAYVLRLLVDADVSLDDGLATAVDLRIPTGLLDPSFVPDPAACPAVSAGNVETSQRVVDVLLQALELSACGQGTMNNVLFGDGSFGFYETVGGGAGATPDGPGASGVHVHMTNTALTDPEVLERRFPVRLERFGLRAGSGGAGRHRGGEGLERIYRFTAPLTLSLVTGRRTIAPPGADGGEPGSPGEQWIERAGGVDGGGGAVRQPEPLGPVAEADLSAGDRLVLRTPGGGGWGVPPDRG